MTVGPDTLPGRWQRWLRGAGLSCVPHPVRSHDDADADPAAGPVQLLLREVFVRADPDRRRALDLLVVGLVERGPASGPARPAELVVLGPDALRARTAGHVAGLTVAELPIGPVGPGLHAVSLALVRVARRTRSYDVASSIEELGGLLDDADPAGSAAVALAVVSRLEVLTSGPGVTVSVAGTVGRPWLDAGPETLYLLADATAPIGPDEEVGLRDGRLTVARGNRLAGWRGEDYLLLRTGRPAGRRGEERSVAQLRREHALVEGSLGAETRERAETYSSQAATARQTLRAANIVATAQGGQTGQAARLLHEALTQPGAEGPLVDQVAGLVGTVGDYWSVLPAVGQAAADPRATPLTRSIAGRLDRRLGERLDALLRLAPGPDEIFIPVHTPIVLEVSDALVPIVDSRQDGGNFLYELIPQARDRIREQTGVRVPGVRARSNPAFGPGQFGIQLDEAWVARGTMLVDGEYAVRSIGTAPHWPAGSFAELHPSTGEWGRWLVEPAAAGPGDAAGGDRLSRPGYLVHRIELAVRAGLELFLGLQEITAMIDKWRAEDADLVRRVLPDERAALRLMLALQPVVAERVPITDWPAVLDAVADAGGITAPVREVRRAVRHRMRAQLPGPRSGPLLVPVPPERQDALAATLDAPAESAGMTRYEFVRWVRGTVETTGTGIALALRDVRTRELAAALARAERDLVVLTFTDEELGSG